MQIAIHEMRSIFNTCPIKIHVRKEDHCKAIEQVILTNETVII